MAPPSPHTAFATISLFSQITVGKVWFWDFGSQSGLTRGSAAIGALFPLGSLSRLVESRE